MIFFKKIKQTDFPNIYKKLESAFPYEERRDFKDYEIYFKSKHFKPFEIIDNETSVGFVNLWEFESYIYIEHLAIDSDIRGGGYGSKAINLVKEKYGKPIILEAEAPETETQIKRIRFYEKLGFIVNMYPYLQPSFHKGEPIPLMILSFPNPLSQNEYDLFIQETRENVYFS